MSKSQIARLSAQLGPLNETELRDKLVSTLIQLDTRTKALEAVRDDLLRLNTLCQNLHRAAKEWEGKLIAVQTESDEALRRLDTALKWVDAVKFCQGDTWECENCANSEPWWSESNADHLTRDIVVERDVTPNTPKA